MARACVLVVDDEPDLVETFRAYLESSLKVKVLGALSGKEALQALDAGGIDLVLADYSMPGMDGLELLRRASKAHPRVLRVLVTGHTDLHVPADQVNQAGISHFITKPIDPDQLTAVLGALLRDPGKA